MKVTHMTRPSGKFPRLAWDHFAKKFGAPEWMEKESRTWWVAGYAMGRQRLHTSQMMQNVDDFKV